MLFLATVPFMYCDAPAAVVSIRKAVDTTHAGAGHVMLSDGASFEISKPDDDSFVVKLRTSDRVQLCYAPAQRFADAGPTARMALAGIVRTGDYVYTLAYTAKKVGTTSFTPALASAIAHLKGTGVPLLVPSIFGSSSLGAGVTFVATHAAHWYRLRFDLAPECNGANVCSMGSIAGYAASAKAAEPTIDAAGRTAVTLADGTPAFFTAAPSGASDGGNSSLSWRRAGVHYIIESRIAPAATLVATANSALRNGPISAASL